MEARRALYVDRKGGGQINFLREFTDIWWKRWQETLGRPFDPSNPGYYSSLGIDYLIVRPENRLPGVTPVYENPKYIMFRLKQ